MTQFKRVVDFDDGVAMIVTDLHGDGRVYNYLKEKFLALHKQGKVQRLIICGDLIHGYGAEEEDASLPMLLDVMRLQQELGRDVVTLLMGNHEMPHIYGISLSKGSIDFTPRFERALSALDKQKKAPVRRKDVLAFLRSLPFFARTQAGVLITHAGASPVVKNADIAADVLDFDHDALLYLYNDKLQGYDLEALKQSFTYIGQAQEYLAIEGENDPRLPELLRAQLISQTSEEFRLLWDVLFSTNEQGWTLEGYGFVVKKFLEFISAHSPYEQRVIVAGHIGVRGGYELVGSQQLRLASYAHAKPMTHGMILLLDCAKPVHVAADLVPHLHPTFET
jgi:hypothetical protein